MDLEGAFFDFEGALCIVCQKVRGPWPLWPPPVPTSLLVITVIIVVIILNIIIIFSRILYRLSVNLVG